MNDETLKKMLGRMDDFYKSMKPGSDCPPDDIILDYVYNDLSKVERQDVWEHIKSCERCRFEVMKLEADRDGWQHAIDKDPDAALLKALGNTDLEQLQTRIAEWKRKASMNAIGTVASVQHPEENFLKPDQDMIDRIAGAAAAEVLDDVDLHMAYWKQTRGQMHYGLDTGLAPASGLGGDIMPFIANAIVSAWEWCVGNRSDLRNGVWNSTLVAHLSSFFQKRRGLIGLNDKEIEVLVNAIAQKVAEAVRRAMGSAVDE
jgi:hypothetical protein